ncbi:MAG: hypothetical protein KatS3mg113_0890 [Planctomycetaceae bacterium]|nr:MAG: hypothetical protein KatS3mg113_0890 [Planctomycetaceae bacterium]
MIICVDGDASNLDTGMGYPPEEFSCSIGFIAVCWLDEHRQNVLVVI